MAKLPDKILDNYEYKPWILLMAGCGPMYFETREEAVASGKLEAEDCPGLVLGLYKLDRFVTATVNSPKLYHP